MEMTPRERMVKEIEDQSRTEVGIKRGGRVGAATALPSEGGRCVHLPGHWGRVLGCRRQFYSLVPERECVRVCVCVSVDVGECGCVIVNVWVCEVCGSVWV